MMDLEKYTNEELEEIIQNVDAIVKKRNEDEYFRLRENVFREIEKLATNPDYKYKTAIIEMDSDYDDLDWEDVYDKLKIQIEKDMI